MSVLPSRRDFLKTSALAAATASTLSLARSAHAAGKEEIRIGVIGCGSRGRGAIANVLAADKCTKIVALGDFFPIRAEQTVQAFAESGKDRFNVPKENIFGGFDNYKGVIAADVDLVLIACAAKFHPLYSHAALQAGKHVFVEKPHAIDADGIHLVEKCIKLAKEKNLCLLSGLMSRYCRQWRATMGKIHDGAIGEIQMMQSTFLRSHYGVYGADPKRSVLENQIWNQYQFSWMSGDDVVQSLVHNLDRMSWAMGDKELPTQCFGIGGRTSIYPIEYGDTFSHHTAVYEFASGKRIYAMCRTEPGCYNSSDDLIIGTKGTVYLGAARIVGETNWQYEGQRDGGHQEEQNDLIAKLKAGETLISGQHMADSTMMGILGQVACYTGKMLKWNDAYESKFVLGPKPEECKDDMEPPVKPVSVRDYQGKEFDSYPVNIPGLCKFF